MGLRVAKHDENANRTHETAKRAPASEGVSVSERRHLDTIANKGSLTRKTSVEARKYRYELRRKARAIRVLPRLKNCGHVPTGSAVSLHKTGTSASWAGLQSCGSVWSCPECSSVIMKQRQTELKKVAEEWATRGSMGFLTLTMRHKKQDNIKALWKALSGAWRAVASGSGWLRDKRDFDISGFVRAVEITHGSNGFHLHIHSLMFLDRVLTEEPAKRLFSRLFARWETALVKAGFEAPLEIAQDFQIVENSRAAAAVGEYLAKAMPEAKPRWGAVEEVTRQDVKRGRHGHRSMFQVLEDALEGDLESINVWRDYEVASKGKRALTWSRGLRDLLELEEELTDEQIAEQEPDEETTELIAIIDAPDWKHLLKKYPSSASDLLTLAEVNPEKARTWLRSHFIPFRLLRT